MRLLFKDKLFVFSVSVVAVLVLLVILAPLSPYAAEGSGKITGPPPSCPGVATEIAGICPPSWAHPFGTELLGRDLFTRILYGMKTSMLIGLYVVATATAIGLAVGLTAAYFGGWFDEILMRFTDIFLSFPHLILALALVSVLGPNFYDVFVALGLTWWPSFARLARGRALAVKSQNYVLAARASGVSNRRILLRHILPNSFSPLIVQMTLDMGIVVLAEAGLSFLGLGVRPPLADLGVMIFNSEAYMTTAWWLALFPGIFLFLMVLSFNLIGDRLNLYLDPRLRKK